MLETMRTVLRVGSIRFSAYYALGFAVGYGSLAVEPTIAILGILYSVTFCLGVELLNRLSDRVEDSINQPSRTALCEQIGFRRIGVLCRCTWVVVAILGFVIVALCRTPSSILLVLTTLVVGIGYSVGPTFKTLRFGGLIAISMAAGFPVICGYVLSTDPPNFAQILTSVLLLMSASLATSGLKDVTDKSGDRARGYVSLWPERLPKRRMVTIFGVAAMFQVMVVLIGLFIGLPLSALGALTIVCVEFGVLRAATRSRDTNDRREVRELMHSATLVVLAVVLISVVPELQSVLLAMGAIGWWAFASTYLHWETHSLTNTIRVFYVALRPYNKWQRKDSEEWVMKSKGNEK